MSHRDYEFDVLDLGDCGALPATIIDDSIAPISVFRELVDAKLLYGEPLLAGGCIDGYECVAITLAGRRRIAELRELRKSRTFKAKSKRFASRAGWAVAGAVGTLLLQWIQKKLNIN